MKQFDEWYINRCYADIYESLGVTPKEFRKMELRYINELRIKYNEGVYNEGLGDMATFPFRMLWKAVKGVGLVTLIGGATYLLTKYGMKSDTLKSMMPPGMADMIDRAIAKVDEKGSEFGKAAWEKIKSYMPDFAGMLKEFICGLLPPPFKAQCLKGDEDREDIETSLASSEELQQKHKGNPLIYADPDDPSKTLKWSTADKKKEQAALFKREKAGYYEPTTDDIYDTMADKDTYGGGTYGKAMAGLGSGLRGARNFVTAPKRWLFPRKKTALSEKDPGGTYDHLYKKGLKNK